MINTWDPTVPPPEEALRRLAEGNRRFLAPDVPASGRPWSRELVEGQRPFAIVLGCSDSRTPVEILFDQGFGELFVVRVAGNVVAPSIIGSIEFAASQFGTRLVVVMGHTRCGAITATIKALTSSDSPASRNIRDITDRIAPGIEALVRSADQVDDDLVREATRVNVRASCAHLRHGSRIIEELVRVGRMVVVGAECELETGRVHFFDGVPPGVAT